MRSAPSSGPNWCIRDSDRRLELRTTGIPGFFYGGNPAALDRHRLARNARARRGVMAAAAELAGDFTHVHARAFGPKADSRQVRLQLFKDARHDDRFDGADVVDETLAVGRVGASARKIRFLQPQPGDLVLLRQPEMV